MKIKVLKKSFTIQGETKEEVAAMAKILEYYMTMVFQPARPGSTDSHYDCDDLARLLDKQFNKDQQ